MRTRRSQFSDDPVLPLDETRGKPRDEAQGKPQQGHRTVLLHEAVDSLDIRKDDIVVDATLGGAGHAQEIARKLGPQGVLIGFDLDADAIARAQKALAGVSCNVELVEANFRDITAQLAGRGINKITKALFDLGWSSYQLNSRLRQGFGGQAGRGFSFAADEPLLMTYKKHPSSEDLTAHVVVNEWSEQTLADIIYGFGGERYSRRIAEAIVEARQKRPVETARQLADIVYRAVPYGYRRGKLHPATRTFQALRIAVNDELSALQSGLRSTFELLAEGGRIAVITFHSLEDRVVKQLFAEFEKAGKGMRFTPKDSELPTGQAKKHFILPSREEIVANRRARSAKLRVFLKKDLLHDKKTSQNKQIPPLFSSGEV